MTSSLSSLSENELSDDDEDDDDDESGSAFCFGFDTFSVSLSIDWMSLSLIASRPERRASAFGNSWERRKKSKLLESGKILRNRRLLPSKKVD